MKKVILSVSLFSILAVSCSSDSGEITTDVVNVEATASGEEPAGKKPVMTFETEEYNFGTITQGEKVSYSFKFKNTGETDLIITNAKGSCGCTVPSWPKEPVAPGAEASIDVVFDSNGKKGKQHKLVTIVANTDPATNKVALNGEVLAPETKTEESH